MFTKLFKKSHDPYELGGRWYKISVHRNGDSLELAHSDLPDLDATLGGTLLFVFPLSYRIVDYQVVYTTLSSGTTVSGTPGIRLIDDGRQAISLSVSRLNDFDIYVYLIK